MLDQFDRAASRMRSGSLELDVVRQFRKCTGGQFIQQRFQRVQRDDLFTGDPGEALGYSNKGKSFCPSTSLA
jgi:hypothetical protein